jgi:hypothetical protein
VTAIAFNPCHDQLILTAGTDALANLHSIYSISSASVAPLSDSDSEHDGFKREKQKLNDGIIETYDFEDSVYAVAWSKAETWEFAGVEYDGKVIRGVVPKKVQYRIML